MSLLPALSPSYLLGCCPDFEHSVIHRPLSRSCGSGSDVHQVLSRSAIMIGPGILVSFRREHGCNRPLLDSQ